MSNPKDTGFRIDGYNPYPIILHPDAYKYLLCYRDIVLKDGNKISMPDEDYMNYTKIYNPPEWDTKELYNERINDMRMVDAL